MRRVLITGIFFVVSIVNAQSVGYPGAVAEFIPSCNYSFNRGRPIDTWVNHWIGVGTYAGAISWFKNCNANASAHFIIRASDGQIAQLVKVNNWAWHAGAYGYPNNQRSIGVEHEVTVTNPQLWNNPALLNSSTNLACYFANQFNIPRTRSLPGIREHNEMPGTNTQCAGPIPWNTWMNLFNSTTQNNCNGGSSNNCPPVQNVNTTFNAGNYSYKASDYIESSSIINAPSNVIFQGTQRVVLKNGFHAKSGSVFRANLDGCN